MELRNESIPDRFAQFLSDANYGRSRDDLQFAYLIMPLPMVPEIDPLRAVDNDDFNERGRFIGDTLMAALRESNGSSWMNLRGSRSFDAGGGERLKDGGRSPGYTEYFSVSQAAWRPEGIRLYEGSNAILARESFADRECFADAWLWKLVKPAHRFARLALAKLAPQVEAVATAGILMNEDNVPLRIVAEFRAAKDYVCGRDGEPFVLGNPPFEVSLNDELAAESIITQMRRRLYEQYGVSDEARSH